jgi:hypothetical protein
MILDYIFIKFGTDKSSEGHGYAPYYEKHLPKEVNSFLEIGAWRGQGIRSFKEWYNHKGDFCVLERYIPGHELWSAGQFKEEGIDFIDGDHDDEVFLKRIKRKWSVVIEDGSHHWYSQIMVFKNLFVNNLESDGLYVIEDVYDDPYWSQNGKVKENIKTVLQKWEQHKTVESQIISKAESDAISIRIKEVHFYKDIIFVYAK